MTSLSSVDSLVAEAQAEPPPQNDFNPLIQKWFLLPLFAMPLGGFRFGASNRFESALIQRVRAFSDAKPGAAFAENAPAR